jgi:FixJ family two-component response regulator
VSAADLGLTERQMEVLALMMRGKSNKAICRVLDLAEPTVKIHVSAILKALKVPTAPKRSSQPQRLVSDRSRVLIQVQKGLTRAGTRPRAVRWNQLSFAVMGVPGHD